MEIHIRRATANDYDDMCELYDEIDTYHRVNLPNVFKKPMNGPAREKEYYLGVISDEDTGFFVAEADGKLAGFIHVFVRDMPESPILIHHHYAVVDGIAIRSEFRNQGLGGKLMEKTQEWAAAMGAEYIELNVHEFNRNAISFYEKLGYQTSSRKMRKSLKKD